MRVCYDRIQCYPDQCECAKTEYSATQSSVSVLKQNIVLLRAVCGTEKRIQEQHRDEVIRAGHVKSIEVDAPEVIKTDEELNRLTAMQNRISDIKSRISDDLETLDVLGKTSESLKKDIAERYKGSVSNGKTTVKVIMKNPPIDYRKAFEFLGGEDAVLNKDESIDSFRRTTGTMQIQIQHGEQ